MLFGELNTGRWCGWRVHLAREKWDAFTHLWSGNLNR